MLLSVLVAQWLTRMGPASSVAALGVMMLVALASARTAPLLPAPYYPDDIACFDQVAARESLREGWAPYWDAKWLTELSRSGARVNQLLVNLRVMAWVNNLSWYLLPAQPPDFIVERAAVPALNRQADLRLGPPSRDRDVR